MSMRNLSLGACSARNKGCRSGSQAQPPDRRWGEPMDNKPQVWILVTVLPASDESSVPKGKAIADPLLRQARDAADALLLGLLQGQFDQDESLSMVAEKLIGYTSWSITSQTTSGQRTAEFKGML